MVQQPSVRDIIQAFFRRKMLFLTVCGAVCLAGATYLLLKQPLYLSSASLVLHFDSQTVPNIDRTENPSQMQGSNEHREVLYSDADILRSPDLARKVIDEIGLVRIYPKIALGKDDDAKKQDAALQSFKDDLVVDAGLQSDVLNVNFLHPDPTIAQDAVQKLVDTFYAQEAAVYANPQLTFAENEAKAAKTALGTAQDNLAAFKAAHHIEDLQQQVTELLKARTDVEARYNLADGRVREAQQRQDALKQLLASVAPTVTSSAIGEQYQAADSAESRLDTLRAKRSQLASTYLPGSPVFHQLDAQISSLEHASRARNGEAKSRSATQPNLVYQSIKTDYLRAAAEATSAQQPATVLGQQLALINSRLADLEKQQNEYDDLTRAVQIQNDTYKTLAIRYETARVEANRNAQKISAAVLIAAPVVPTQSARPRRKLIALATLVAALMIGAGTVLAIEAFDDTFMTPRDVTRTLRLPVLATFSQDT